jgi:4-hydroxythreonine-4-phosphate dehydrogenase
MLADLTKAEESGMMIVGGPLKILFATTHLALREVPKALTSATILRAIRLAHQGLTRLFHIQKPRIGVAGLNPHAGENGLFGDEEDRLIRPAIQQAKKQGIACTGPHPADTLFGQAVRGSFDGIVALYHDQGLIPLKTVAFGHCVNITVGLPIIRTSVDHGTAYDIAGQGKADPTSLVEAIEMAARLATGSI